MIRTGQHDAFQRVTIVYADEIQSFDGGWGFTSVTAVRSWSTTLLPLLPPMSLISFSLTSVALSASSSAFLLPLECCGWGKIVSA